MNHKQTNKWPIKKCGHRTWTGSFQKKKNKMSKKCLKKYLSSLVIREMEIKTISRCHLTPVYMEMSVENSQETKNKCTI